MICDKCKNKVATTHIHTVINGTVRDEYLCAECAAKRKNEELYDNGILDMLNLFLGEEPKADNKRCEVCGSNVETISRTGKMGCSNCYKVFRSEIEPTLIRLHGKTGHVGKRPQSAVEITEKSEEKKPENELSKLKERLKKAIAEENYEEAAVIRDRIREKEGK